MSTSYLKRVIKRSIDPQRHANDGGWKSSSPGSACASGEDDSSSCARVSSKHVPPVWHSLSPHPITISSMQRSQLTPSPYNSVYTKLNLMNYTAFSLRVLFGREHTAPAYNHNPSGDEEHNE